MGAEASTPQVHRAPSNLERAAPPPPTGGGSSGGIGIGRNVLNAFSGQKLEDTCEIIRGRKPLGKGSFGTVWAAKLKNGKMAAVKALDKRRMKELKVPDSLVKAEVDLMREVSGKAEFVQLIDFVDTSASFFLVLEFCDGGDLEDATKADQDKLGERQVASFIKQMLEGLAHLHAKTICHRDIKPQNAMVVGRATSERAKVKLGDFGIAVKLPRDQLMKEKVGTPAFMAPEMHLLPGRSAGYDHKVDLWAMGAVMVFLLAHEYPFVDGSGRLMRDQLLKGDLPIWDANVFSGLFQRVQEVAGMKRPKPSPVAQDLVRCLLNPKRQHRMGASTALRHRWFAPPKPEEVRREQEQAGDDAPMLVWSDFEEGFSSIDREFQRLASAALDAAESAFGNVQVGLSDIQHIPMLDPEDDRIRSCVVCYHGSGSFGYLCPQCHHTVCVSCLQKLPKAECPHCRHAASDVAVTQAIARFASGIQDDFANSAAAAQREAAKANADLHKAALAVASGTANVDIGLNVPCGKHHSEEARLLRESCFYCKEASASTNHVCTTCSASVCFPCAKRIFPLTPDCSCPCCQDPSSRQAIRDYLDYADTLSYAMGFISTGHGALTARATQFGDALRRSASDGFEALTRHSSQGESDPGFDSAALKRSLTGHSRLEMDHQCFSCSKESSPWDIACPQCLCSLCSGCLRQRVAHDPRCPNCKAPEFCDPQTVSLTLKASQVADSASLLWTGLVGVGTTLFSTAGPEAVSMSSRPAMASEARLPQTPRSQRTGTGQPHTPKCPPEPLGFGENSPSQWDAGTPPVFRGGTPTLLANGAASPKRRPGPFGSPSGSLSGSPSPSRVGEDCQEPTLRCVPRTTSMRSAGSLGPSARSGPLRQVTPRDDVVDDHEVMTTSL